MQSIVLNCWKGFESLFQKSVTSNFSSSRLLRRGVPILEVIVNSFIKTLSCKLYVRRLFLSHFISNIFLWTFLSKRCYLSMQFNVFASICMPFRILGCITQNSGMAAGLQCMLSSNTVLLQLCGPVSVVVSNQPYQPTTWVQTRLSPLDLINNNNTGTVY